MALYNSAVRIVMLAACTALISPAARAFTIEDGSGKSATPKFDIEEQSRYFRKGDLDTPAGGSNAMETPFGKLQFGVQRQTPMFGSPLGSGFGSNSAVEDRRHFDRMLAPPTSQERFQ